MHLTNDDNSGHILNFANEDADYLYYIHKYHLN